MPLKHNNSLFIPRLSLIILLLTPAFFISIMTFCPIRLKIGDYYFEHKKFDQAVSWYEKIVRKDNLKNTYNKQVIVKFGKACFHSAILHLNESSKHLLTNTQLAESELRRVLAIYEDFCRKTNDYFIRNQSNLEQPVHMEFFPLIRKTCIDLSEIYKRHKPEAGPKLYSTFWDLYQIIKGIWDAEESSTIFGSLNDINLLPNPSFDDLDDDGIPDNYVFAKSGQEATLPSKEVIRSDESNIYHVWQEHGKGWFATYFNIGRVPPNTFFTFSIDIKRIHTEGTAHAMLYTTRISNEQWGSGTDYSEASLVEDLKDGWRREFYTIKTKGYTDILLSGWIVAWGYGQAGGHIYVRRPKLVLIGMR